MEGRRVGEGEDMTGKSYENLGGGRIIGGRRYFSGVDSLMGLEFW
jgi:hypothetical protein